MLDFQIPHEFERGFCRVVRTQQFLFIVRFASRGPPLLFDPSFLAQSKGGGGECAHTWWLASVMKGTARTVGVMGLQNELAKYWISNVCVATCRPPPSLRAPSAHSLLKAT